jgi:transcription elongation factor S-II
MRQSKDTKISSLANNIVANWRDEVAKQKTGASKRRTDNASQSAQGGETMAQISSPLDKRTWKRDNVDVKRTDSSIRNNCVGLLYDGLAYNSDDGEDSPPYQTLSTSSFPP